MTRATVPTDGTVQRVARPRGEIPEPQLSDLIRTRDSLETAEHDFLASIRRAITAGGSYSEVARVAGIAKSTVQKIVGSK